MPFRKSGTWTCYYKNRLLSDMLIKIQVNSRRNVTGCTDLHHQIVCLANNTIIRGRKEQIEVKWETCVQILTCLWTCCCSTIWPFRFYVHEFLLCSILHCCEKNGVLNLKTNELPMYTGVINLIIHQWHH